MFENLNKIKKFSILLLLLLNITFVFAARSSQSSGGIENIQRAMGTLCFTAQSLIVVVAIVLAVMSALVYAVGQILGAETRARATVWATAMFTGAIIGIIIYLVVPVIIGVMLTGSSDTSWVAECCKPQPTDACTSLGQ